MRKSSPWLRFAYFLGFTFLLFFSIHLFRKAETPPWRKTGTSAQTAVSAPKPLAQFTQRDQSSCSFRFLSYNLKNWLTSNQTPEKSAESKQVIIRTLVSSEADVIGLSEIGSDADVREIQKLLKQAGQNFPYFHHTGGTDPIRHLAILSRFPIGSVVHPAIEIPGTNESIQRGILDVTILIDQQPHRFLGLHLKSKRVVPNFDQAELRIREAEHVRKHIDSILEKDPGAKLIVYGDFNDHIQSVSTRTILGSYGNDIALTPIQLKDSRGEKWTHYFQSQDQYSRIDFITVSKSLRSQIDPEHSRIIDLPTWNTASDHRPILATFK